MSTTYFNVRVDSDIKKRCEALYAKQGINLSEAIEAFMRQSLSVGGFPFDFPTESPNVETLEALKEAESMVHNPSVHLYSDIEEALRALKD